MTSDLDLPLLPSADQIRRREFATIRRGYDPDQVREYLKQVANQVETLEKGLREARMEASARTGAAPESPGEVLAAKMGEPGISPIGKASISAPAAAIAPEPPAAPASDGYERLAKRFEAMIRVADTEATKVVTEAKNDAGRIMEEARTDADHVRVDAQARAEEARQQGVRTLRSAREEADSILGGLSDRRETLVTQMQEMQSRLLNVARDLEAAVIGRAGADGAPSGDDAPDAIIDETAPDPRYEKLWAPGDDRTVDIPDLATIDDIDDDPTS